MALRKYKSHKIVEAGRIVRIDKNLRNAATLTLDSGDKVEVGTSYAAKHNPQIGGYYIRYADGYESWLPAKSFEEGYTELGHYEPKHFTVWTHSDAHDFVADLVSTEYLETNKPKTINFLQNDQIVASFNFAFVTAWRCWGPEKDAREKEVTPKQRPSIGRVVHYRAEAYSVDEPKEASWQFAVIIWVHEDDSVNLKATDRYGNDRTVQNVKEGTKLGCWRWPPRV